MVILVILIKQYLYTLCVLFEVDTDIQFYGANSLRSLKLQNGRNPFIYYSNRLKETFFLHFVIQFLL